MSIMRSWRKIFYLKVKNQFYDAVRGKNSSVTRRIIFSLLFAIILAGIYSLWLFGTSRLEIDFECPKNDVFFQVFYFDGKPGSIKSKSINLYRGKNKLSFIFFNEKIKVIRIDPACVCDVQLKISKVKYSKGLVSREISFDSKTTADTLRKVNLYQLRYQGNGYFLTTGGDPQLSFKLKDIPKTKNLPFYSIALIIVLALSFFYWHKILFYSKRLIVKIELMMVRIKNRMDCLLGDYPFWIYALIIILLGWGFELFNFTLTIDDETIFEQVQNLALGWMRQERWGMALIAFLTGNPTVPVIPLAITLFCCFLSFCILFYSPNRTDKYYILPIYVAFPVLFQSFSFSSLNPGIGIAFLLSASAVYLINKRSKIGFLLAILLSSFAIGTYEVFIVYIGIAGVYCWLFRGIRHDFYCRFKYIRYIACKYIFLAASSFLFHKTILYIGKTLYGIKYTAYISGIASPIKDFSLWFQLISPKIWQYWSGGDQLFPKEMIFQIVIIAVCLLTTIFFILRGKKKFFSKCLLFLGVLFLLFMPFFPFVFHQYAGIPARVLTLLVPVGLVSIFHLALVISQPYKLLRILIAGLLFFISIQYLWNLNQNTYLNYMQNKRDILVLSKLQNRINSIPEFAQKAAYEKKIPVIIIGSNRYDQIIPGPRTRQPYPNWHSEIIGISIFTESFRLVNMMNIFCYPHFARTSILQAKSRIPKIESMPMWPLNGSIAFYKNCLIIKLSDHLPRHSKELDRKLLYQPQFSINGLEELTATQTDKMRLLHTYSVSALKDPKVKAAGNVSQLNVKNTNRTLVFPARKFNAPYVILEITADFDKADTLSLWYDQAKQCIRFAFNAGENHLKLRCPAYFLNKRFLIGFGAGKVDKVLLKDIKVFDDAQYTDNLIRLNPELDRKKLMEMLHD